MDLFLPIILCVIFFVLFSLCGWCCKRKQRAGIVYGYVTTPVTVTTQHVAHNQSAAPPYPMNNPHPIPQHGMSPGAPNVGFVTQGGYPPYPMGAAAPGGVYPPVGPYAPTVHQLPPSYNEAVNHPPVSQPPITEAYAKQAPYNPHY